MNTTQNLNVASATLNLFNAIQFDGVTNRAHRMVTLDKTIPSGYFIDQRINVNSELAQLIEDVVGLSGERANAAFHKSWDVVANSPIEILVLQQVIHYVTTYGFQAAGMYDESTVYIPAEKLEVPEITKDIPLTFVRGLTSQQLLDSIVELDASGIALSETSLDAIMIIVEANDYDSQFVQAVKNRELQARLFDFYGLVPSEPEDYLRYVVYKLTSDSQVVKGRQLDTKIKEADGAVLDDLLQKAPANLASIYLRNKRVFLAMKTIGNKDSKHIINRLRKDTKTQHVPLPVDYLNSVTHQIKSGSLDLDMLAQRLESATIFRKIRLAYALKFRLDPSSSILYRVRNGQGWVEPFEWDNSLSELTQNAFDVVMKSIAGSIDVAGKTYYIPSHVHYGVPATEKQFSDNIPAGSYVVVPADMIVGVHWFNTEQRVDLDLSTIGVNGKTGWNAQYRNDSRSLMFSGDITSAPKPEGAAELFYLEHGDLTPQLLMLNYFGFQDGDKAECKLFVAREQRNRNRMNDYMVDPNNILASANLPIDKPQNVLGLFANVDGENRFYFSGASVGKSSVSSDDCQTAMVRDYLANSVVDSLDLEELLTMAGATVIHDMPDADADVELVDLSPPALNKSTIINIIS